jgi:endonuclease I
MKKILLLLAIITTFTLVGCTQEVPEDVSIIDQVKDALVLPDTVDEDTVLPTLVDGVVIVWSSNIDGTLTSNNEIIEDIEERAVSLTAVLSYEGKTRTKLFNVTIESNGVVIDNTLEVLNETLELLTQASLIVEQEIVLPDELNGVAISWVSSNPDVLNIDGTVVQPTDVAVQVTLTATLILNSEFVTKVFSFTIQPEEQTVTYEGYYMGAGGLDGEALKAFLNELIDDHTFVSYGDLRDILQITDEDPNNPNNIILFYTGLSIPSTWDSGISWNREHVWARSHGGLEGSNSSGDDEYSDMHQIRPTHPSVNSSRSNLDFDNGGSLVPNTDDCYYDGDSFEPRDEVKGDVARIIFYMVVRYEGYDGELDLEMNELVDNDGPYMGKLSVLLEWHLNDLPDAFEINRNNIVFTYQGNRNPFIDHPEFATLIWGS